MKTCVLTIIALIAFAGNSILCRIALGDAQIDAAGFTVARLISAAIFLYFLVFFNKRTDESSLNYGSWWSSIMLFIYAICFSFAYLTLDTGTGALILFGSVQLCMLTMSKLSGERFSSLALIGLLTALFGFIYLVFPTLSTPSLIGFVLMSLSGVAWGLYTLAGKGAKQPSAETSMNFIRTLPLALIVLPFVDFSSVTTKGLIVAMISGIVTSGIGYIIWYKALPLLTGIQAAVSQLLVPVIAAIGGFLFLSEPISTRLIIASILILGGVLLVSLEKSKE
ncbi:DMT family transporter [Pseudoalteromonas phenolica]|uniref:DMT family transporter n=1 Tax=Pseudoalteromonas phenolica TaxID=161398 RepID=UPI001486B109|nr:DMT family transporter [Pseudoalteromonas phenolica]